MSFLMQPQLQQDAFGAARGFMSGATGGQVQGTSVAFNAITGTDTMMKNNIAHPINIRHQCITCMKEYEGKSLEELRFEDYQLGRKGSAQGGLFGSPAPQQTGGLFSLLPGNNNTTNTFGQRNTTFGAASPSPAGGLFPNLNQPKTNFFSSAPTTSAFGASTFGNSGFGTSTFSFSNPNNQPAGVFGQGANTTLTTGGLGSNTGFSFTNPNQQTTPTMNLFGQKQLTTAPAIPTSNTFGTFGSPTNTLNKPMPMFGTPNNTGFGTTTPAFGTPTPGTNLFGSTLQQQPKPFTFSGFGTTPQPALGTAGNSTFSFSNPAPATNLGFAASTPPKFGTATSTGFGTAPFGTNNFSSFSNPTTNTGFTSTPFNFTNPSGTNTGFSFLNSGQPTLGQVNLQQQAIPQTGPVQFATTPYKDSPLFYNLITNRNLDEMTKPTNPLAQRAIREAARRRTSSNYTSSGTSANIRNLTFPVSKNQIFNKKNSIFEGFEEEDNGSTIDILSPKTSVKKLQIKSFNTSRHSMPSLHSASISKATGSTLDESGPFEVSGLVVSRHNGYPSDTYGETNTPVDEGNTSINGLPVGTGVSGTDFSNRLNAGSPDNSAVESCSNDPDNISRISSTEGNNSILGRSLNGIGSCGVVSTRPGYYIHPSLAELERMTTENGDCFVRGLVIGRHNFGSIRFLDTVNIAGINLDEIFMFRHKEVSVYPDDDAKPPVGQGINCAAEIQMERVWPIDKETRDPIKSPPRIRALNYEDKLRRSCKRMDAEFVSYNNETGIWVFRVAHFSKYSCVPEESEEDVENLPPPVIQHPKGLGGISAQELKSGALLSPPPQTSHQAVTSDVPMTAEPNTMKPNTWAAKFHSTPMVRASTRLNTSGSKPRDPLQLAGREMFLSSADNEIDIDDDGDIDYNPLTPSEYDSGDSDRESCERGISSMPTKHSLYGSIIRDAFLSPKLSMMKSVLSNELNPLTEEMEETGMASPPTKKSRAPRTSFSERKKIKFSDVGDNRADSLPMLSGFQMAVSTSEVANSVRPAVPPFKIIPGRNGYDTVEIYQAFKDSTAPILVRPYRKRKEVDKVVGMESPPSSMFSGLNLLPASVSARRRGSRISFGPSGHFVCVKAIPSQVSTQVEILRLDSYAITLDPTRATFYKAAVEGQLEFQFRRQCDQGWRDSQSIAREDQLVMEAGGNASAQKNFLQRHSEHHHSNPSTVHLNLLKDELQVWSLCQILWPKKKPPLPLSNPEFLIRQRKQLTKWFQVNSQMLFGKLYDETDKSVKGYLMKGMQLEACEEAIYAGNINLALCLAEDCSQARSTTKFQITQWQVEEVDGFIGHSVKTLYQLCAGLAIWENVDFNNMTTSEWLQHFAIYLWYISPPHATIQEVITRYQCLIIESAGTHNKERAYPMQADSSFSNLCINLLKLFAFQGYPLKNVLDPCTSNPDCLDYKLSWLLMLNVEEFGGFLIEKNLKESITFGLANMLENMGLFVWAVYVIKHLPVSQNRKIAIRRILERNLMTEENQDDEHFLINFFAIESREIFDAKVLSAALQNRMYDQMWYLFKTQSYEKSFKIFQENLDKNCLVAENIKSLDVLIGKLYFFKYQIHDWPKHGQMFYSFFCALKEVHREDKGRLELISDVRNHIRDMLVSLSRVQPKNSTDIHFLLELCTSVKKAAEMLIEGKPTKMSTGAITQYPPLQNLNKKCWSEYVEDVRQFFSDLNY